MDLPGEFNVSATFNVADLSPFDVDDDSSRILLKRGGMMSPMQCRLTKIPWLFRMDQ